MDDNVQKQPSNNPVSNAGDQTSASIQSDTQVVPTHPPVALPQKEQEPAGGMEAPAVLEVESPQPEAKASEILPNIPPEVSEAGVEAVSEHPVLTQVHHNVGIQYSPESLPVAASIVPDTPYTQEDAGKVFASTKTGDSSHWLSALVLKVFRVLGGKK